MLLTLPKEPKLSDQKRRKRVSLRDLVEAGVIEPPRTLVGDYKGHRLTATVDGDGNVICLGITYASLSTAAGMAIGSVVDTPASARRHAVNGWIFWKLPDKHGELQPIGHLRKQYRETQK